MPSVTQRRSLVGRIAAAAALMAACALPGPEVPSPGVSVRPTITPAPAASASAYPTPAATSILTLRQRVAGLLVVGFRGKVLAPDDPILRAIRDDGLGGVILFGRNITSPQQLAELTATLQEAAGDRTLLICIDQEGGSVARLGPEKGFPETPSAAVLGRREAAYAELVGSTTAETLAAGGVNLNLAPVVDLNVNPANPSIGALGRSFSKDPDVVVDIAAAVIRGHHQVGLLTTLKHFPGLGSATGDTDRAFVDVTESWTPGELEPFRRLIGSGLANVVMVGNALNGQLDPDLPSSLSAATVRLLRKELDWDGAVITDDLQAGALRDNYTDEQIATLALTAGSDLLLYANTNGHDAELATHMTEVIVRLVQRGEIDPARIDEAFGRASALAQSLRRRE